MHGHVQLAGNGIQPVHLPKVFGGDAAVQLHVHPARPQKAHRGKGLFKAAGASAQGLVGGVIGPIEGDVHPPGLVVGKKVGPLFIQQGAVGVQGKHHALGLQVQIQLLKSGHQQQLAAGEQQKQHPRPGHGVGQFGPLLAGAQGARGPGLPGRKAHIAHTAVHIAQGGQLQTAADGAATVVQYRITIVGIPDTAITINGNPGSILITVVRIIANLYGIAINLTPRLVDLINKSRLLTVARSLCAGLAVQQSVSLNHADVAPWGTSHKRSVFIKLAFAIARDCSIQRIARRYIFIGLKLLHQDARRLPVFLHASSASFKIWHPSAACTNPHTWARIIASSPSYSFIASCTACSAVWGCSNVCHKKAAVSFGSKSALPAGAFSPNGNDDRLTGNLPQQVLAAELVAWFAHHPFSDITATLLQGYKYHKR